MLKVSIWAKLAVVLVVAAGILIALPNALSDKVRGRFPSWLPSKTVSLGLDLQGGSYLLLEVDFDQVQKDKIEALVGDIRTKPYQLYRPSGPRRPRQRQDQRDRPAWRSAQGAGRHQSGHDIVHPGGGRQAI